MLLEINEQSGKNNTRPTDITIHCVEMQLGNFYSTTDNSGPPFTLFTINEQDEEGAAIVRQLPSLLTGWQTVRTAVYSSRGCTGTAVATSLILYRYRLGRYGLDSSLTIQH
jgi:hypothetical protein